jgi:molybdate transport system substrate-binding protein
VATALAAGVVAACALVAGCGGSDDSTRVVVSAGSSMRAALERCGPRFGKAEGAELRLSFGGSDQLAAQIRQGATVDVFAAANTRLPDDLNGDLLVEEPVDFATNEFVLAVPKHSAIDSLDDLTADGTKLVVGSDSVPIGIYTRETLAKLPADQEKAILANVRSSEPDVNGIVGKLTQGAADAGFVYVTDVKATHGELRAIELPEELDPHATYAAAVVTKAEEPEIARKFVEGLKDGDCADALAEAGFGPAP